MYYWDLNICQVKWKSIAQREGGDEVKKTKKLKIKGKYIINSI